MKKGTRKCMTCLTYKKCKFKKGSKNFCSLKCKGEYYVNHLPTQKKETQILFNRLIAKDQPCAMCGKRFEIMHCSHILSVGAHENLRYDILNALPMDGRCHKWFWHDNPLKATEWFKSKYPQRYNYLMFAQNQFRKWTIEEIKEIQEAIKERNFKNLIRFKREYATN